MSNEHAGDRMNRSLMGVIALSLFVRVVAFGRDLLFASVFGLSAESDAYFIASLIPVTFAAAVGVALTTVTVPILAIRREEGGEHAVERYSSTMFNWVLLVASIATVGIIVASDGIIAVLASGLPLGARAEAAKLLRLMAPSVLGMMLTGFYKGILNHNNEFISSQASTFPLHGTVIVACALAAMGHRVEVVAIGTAVGAFAQLAPQLWALRKRRCFVRVVPRLTDAGLRSTLTMLGPILLAQFLGNANAVIDRSLASGLPEGSLSALAYAYKVHMLPIGILIVTGLGVVYPRLCELSAEGKLVEFANDVRRYGRLISLVILPVTVWIIVLAEPIIGILYKRGSFSIDNVIMTTAALRYYALCLVAVGWWDLLTRASFALKDSYSPLIIHVVSVSVNVAANVLLVRLMMHEGLALGFAIGVYVGAAGAGAVLARKLEGFSVRGLFRDQLPLVVPTVACTAVALGVRQVVPLDLQTPLTSSVVYVSVIVTLSGLVYLVTSYVAGVGEVRRLMALTYMRLRGKKCAGVS